jgi:hypothetical protein
MPEFCREILAMRKMARSWGGDIVRVGAQAYKNLPTKGTHAPKFYPSPQDSDLGVDWCGRRVIVSGKVCWIDVLHELGHAFAVEESPEDIDDDNVFLGWEYAMVKHIGADSEFFRTQNQYYVLENGDYLGDFSKSRQIRILEGQVRKCIKAGMVSSGGVPLCKPRIVDTQKILARMRQLRGTASQVALETSRRPVTNGKDFESRVHVTAYAEGFRDAVYELEKLLAVMSVSPIKL